MVWHSHSQGWAGLPLQPDCPGAEGRAQATFWRLLEEPRGLGVAHPLQEQEDTALVFLFREKQEVELCSCPQSSSGGNFPSVGACLLAQLSWHLLGREGLWGRDRRVPAGCPQTRSHPPHPPGQHKVKEDCLPVLPPLPPGFPREVVCLHWPQHPLLPGAWPRPCIPQWTVVAEG